MEKDKNKDIPTFHKSCPTCGHFGFYSEGYKGIPDSDDEIEIRVCSKCHTKYYRLKKRNYYV